MADGNSSPNWREAVSELQRLIDQHRDEPYHGEVSISADMVGAGREALLEAVAKGEHPAWISYAVFKAMFAVWQGTKKDEEVPSNTMPEAQAGRSHQPPR